MLRRLFRKNWLLIRHDHHTATSQIEAFCHTRWGAEDLAWRKAIAWGKAAPSNQITRYSWTTHPYGVPIPYAPLRAGGRHALRDKP